MAALDDGNNANNIGAQENEAVPLREYGNMQREQVVIVGVSPDISIYNDTNKLRAATAQAVSELGDEYGALKDLTLPNGVPSGLWTITKPMGGGLLGAPGAQLFTIALNSLGARTGVVLDGVWAPAPVMGWLSEAAAAVNLYNVQNAGPVAHFVCFDPDISRFGKNCRDKSIIGTSLSGEQYVLALRALAATAYGPLRYHRISGDASPQVVIGARMSTYPWVDIKVTVKKMLIITGFEMDEFGDSTASGPVLGVLGAELGDVTVLKVSAANGFEKTRRVLIECQMSDGRRLDEAVDQLTAAAKMGRGILVDGALVTIVSGQAAALEVYKNLHKLQVREQSGAGGSALRDQLSALSEKLSEAEERAVEEREAAAVEMQRLAAELQRLGASAVNMEAALGAAEAKAAEQAEVATARTKQAEESAAKVIELTQGLADFVAQSKTRQVIEDGQSSPTITMVERGDESTSAAPVTQGLPRRGRLATEAAARAGAPRRAAGSGTGGACHSAGAKGRAQAVAFLLCLAGTSPMSHAGRDSAPRGCGAGPAEGGVGGKFGDSPSCCGGGAAFRSGWWVRSVCESSAALLERGGARWGARDSSCSFRPLLPPLEVTCNSSPTLEFGAWCDEPSRGGGWCGGGGCGVDAACRVRRTGEAGGGLQTEVESGRGRGAGEVGRGIRYGLGWAGRQWPTAGTVGARGGESLEGSAGVGNGSEVSSERAWRGGGQWRAAAVPAELCTAGGVCCRACRRPGGCGPMAGGAGGLDGGAERWDGAATAGRVEGDGQGRREAAEPWQAVVGCPQSEWAVGARCYAKRGAEGGSVGYRRGGPGSSYGVSAGGAADAAGGRTFSGVEWAEGRAADAPGDEGSGAICERWCGGRRASDASKGGGGVDGHRPGVGGVAGGGAQAVRGGVVGGDGRRGGRAPRARAVAERGGDGEGEGSGARGAGVAVRWDVCWGDRLDLYGRSCGRVAVALRGGGREGVGAARVPERGLFHPEGAEVLDGEADGGAAGGAARCAECDAGLPVALVGAAAEGEGERAAAVPGVAGAAGQGPAEAAGGRGDGAEGGGEVRAAGHSARGDGRTAVASQSAVRGGADGAAELAICLAARGDRLLGVRGGASSEAAAVGGRAARLAHGSSAVLPFDPTSYTPRDGVGEAITHESEGGGGVRGIGEGGGGDGGGGEGEGGGGEDEGGGGDGGGEGDGD